MDSDTQNLVTYFDPSVEHFIRTKQRTLHATNF